MQTVNMAIEAAGHLKMPLAQQRLYSFLSKANEANRVHAMTIMLAGRCAHLSHAAADPCSRQLPHLQPGMRPGHHITFLPVPAMHVGAYMSSTLFFVMQVL